MKPSVDIVQLRAFFALFRSTHLYDSGCQFAAFFVSFDQFEVSTDENHHSQNPTSIIMKITFSRTVLTSITLIAGSLLAHADVIQPVAVVSEEYVYTPAIKLINGEGLEDNKGITRSVTKQSTLSEALNTQHLYDGLFAESFVSTDLGKAGSDLFASLPDGDTDVDLVFDLTGGGNTALNSVLLWQYQNVGDAAYAVGNHTRSIEIRVNTEAQGKTSFSASPTLVTLKPVTDGDEDEDPNNDLGGNNTAQAFPLAGSSSFGRYVQVSITDNYLGHQKITGGGDRVGLGEIRFVAATTKAKKIARSKVDEPNLGAAIISLGGVSILLQDQ